MKSNPSQVRRNDRHDLAARTESGARTDSSRASRHGRANAAGHGVPAARPCRMSRRSLALADLKLAQIEDAFLDMLLDAHPRRATALDRLLDDLAAADPAEAPAAARAALPVADADVAAASSRRIESALLGAVIRRHPRRDAALDRLMCDLELAPTAPEAAHGAWADEEDRRRAEFDVACDNDFDGLG
jgi:hypothetical protein